MVGYVKEDRRASEASLKYVLYGSVSSGAMIFGFSLLSARPSLILRPSLGPCSFPEP